MLGESAGSLLSNKGIFTVLKRTGDEMSCFVLFHPFVESIELNSLFYLFILLSYSIT